MAVPLGGIRRAALLLAVLLFAVGCNGGSDGDGGDAGDASEDATDAASNEPWELTIALSSDMSDIDPHTSTTNWNQIVWYGNVGERLTAVQNGEVVPSLATSWELVGETTWRFELQEGVEFHNGEPFNADAVVYSMERLLAEETASTITSFFGTIDRAEAVDEHTVDIHTKRPDPFLPQYPMPYLVIVPPEHSATSLEAISDEPVGTGPYKFVSASTDAIVVEKNPDYWGGEVEGPDKVTIVPRPEVSSRISGLQAGELDIVRDVPPELVEDVPKVQITAGSRNHQLLINAVNGPTADIRVRQAIAYATDRDGAAEAIWGEGNYFPTSCQFVPEGVIGHVDDPALDAPPYDPDRARELLEEAGAVGAKVRLAVPIGRYPNAEQVAEHIAQQLEEVGFDVEFLATDFDTFLQTARTPADTRVEIVYIGSTYDSQTVAQPWSYWLQPQTPYLNFKHEDYPELKPMVDEVLSEHDEDRRGELFREIATMLCDEYLYLQLLQESRINGAAEDITFVSYDEVFPFALITRD